MCSFLTRANAVTWCFSSGRRWCRRRPSGTLPPLFVVTDVGVRCPPTVPPILSQALVQEEAIRHFATTLAYRMNLDDARSADPVRREAERRRFLK